MSRCSDARDFIIQSVPSGVEFPVNRARILAASQVFSDMFACCDSNAPPPGGDDTIHDTLQLQESPELLSLLLRIIEAPELSSDDTQPPDADLILHRTIPFPLLPPLFQLADKYILADAIVRKLEHHLRQNAPSHPFQVFCCATSLNLPLIAACASKYLHSPPLHMYSLSTIRSIPTVEAYHHLVLLHGHRIDRFREILRLEELFPFGYGACPQHMSQIKQRWDMQKMQLLPLIHAASDIADEMETALGHIDCPLCARAVTSATAMMKYKCDKVPKSIKKFPLP
ncbi:hypothetical protein BOTBODRAFT_50721 [Botryobasidium botryosum FD-172 SS1]|uniref:BTB domain-containing protein n=1 Tax=Botryobasidium botryosum (strain FD-172 SS1) TaxID=930990 RepID=A0A067MY18_BOTB1|nr:hypothetical protein BOTBODRAFT_50721 [Botryobasidium botryosum FD-172 SS1]